MNDSATPRDHDSITELIRRLTEAEAALNEALGSPVDAVIDPDRARPILLVEAQKVLRESETRYNRLTARIAAVVIEMEPDGTIRFVNDAASVVTGYRISELLGQRAQDILFPGALRPSIDRLLAHFQSSDVTGFELVLAAKHGREVVLEFNSANQYRSDGTLDKIVGLGIDITQRKQAEQELETYHQRLENMVFERTDQLQAANEALRESEERYRLAARATQDVIYDWNLTTRSVHWNIAIASRMGYLEALQGTSINWWRERIHPEDHESVIRHVASVLDGTEDHWSAEYRFRKADGDYAFVLDRGYVGYNEDGSPARMVGAMFDATNLRTAETAEREQRLMAEALRDIALKTISVFDLPGILDTILTSVDRLVSYDTLDLICLEQDGRTLITRSRGYEKYGMASPVEMASFDWWEHPLLQQVVQLRRPVVVPDVQDHGEAWIPTVPVEWRHSYVGVPILLQEEVIGFINLMSTAIDFYTPPMIERLQLLAHQAALAVHSARLYQQAQLVAASRERERLARELHDAVSQTLFSASLMAEALQQQWQKADPARVEARLRQLVQLTRGAQAEMRTLLIELRPTALLETSLADLIPQLVTTVRSRKQIEVNMQVDETINPPPDVKVCLYRIAQESLNNVVKHSGATQVTVRLQMQHDLLEMEISDNGRGFDPARIAADSFGLKIIRERAEVIGAQVIISSAPQRGTSVNVMWLPALHS